MGDVNVRCSLCVKIAPSATFALAKSEKAPRLTGARKSLFRSSGASTTAFISVARNGNLNFLQTDVTNALAQFGGAKGLDGSITQTTFPAVSNVFVPTWLRVGRGIVTAARRKRKTIPC